MKRKKAYIPEFNFYGGVWGFLVGASFLTLLATLQKMIVGAPLVIHGYILPVLFGGSTGFLVNAWRIKLKKVNHTLRELNHNLELKVNERTKELRRVIEGLKESESRYQTLFNTISDAVYIHDVNGKILDVNRVAHERLGYTKDEILNLYASDVDVNYPNKKIVRETIRPAITAGPLRIESQHRAKDNSVLNVDLHMHVFQENGKDIFVTVARDITDQKQLMNELRKSEDGLNNLIDGSIQGILIHCDHEPLFVNRQWAQIHGYTREEILKMPSVLPLISLEDQGRLLEYNDARIENKKAPEDYEYQGIHKNGARIWLNNKVRTIEWKGRPAVQTTIFDITKPKLTRQALERSEKRFRQMADLLPGAVVELGLDMRITYVNQHGLDLFEYSQKDIDAGMLAVDLIHPEEIDKAAKRLSRYHEMGKTEPTEYRILKKRGTYIWMLLNAAAVYGKGQIKSYILVLVDIEKRKKIEAERENLISQLTTALSDIKELQGLLPICSACKNIRDDEGYWHKIESYLSVHSDVQFSHSMCPECSDKFYGDQDWYIKMKKNKNSVSNG